MKFVLSRLFFIIIIISCSDFAFTQGDSTARKLNREAVHSLEGKSFPEFQLLDLDNRMITKRFFNRKVVVLNFWFIYCHSCIEELPELNKVFDYFSGREDVLFIAIALDDREKLKKFLLKKEFKYRVLHSGKQFSIKQLGIRAYPSHIIINRDGIVSFIKTGEIDDSKEFIKIVESITNN